MNLKILSIYLLSLVFFSCNRDIDINIPTEPSKIVVESYLSVGDSLLVRINESGPPNRKAYDNKYINNASVTIKVDNQILQLQYTSQPIPNGGEYGPEFINIRQGSYYYLPRSVHQVKPNTTYTLSVSFGGRTVQSSIQTIEKTPILSAQLFPILHGAGDTTVGFRIQANYPFGDSYYKAIWYVRGPFRIQQPGLDTTIIIVGKAFQTVFIHSSGQSQTREFDTKQKYQSSTISDVSGFACLKHITKLQHDFLQAIDVQKDDYSLFTETTDIPTNIEGGYGIFTSTVSDTLTNKIGNIR